MIPSASDLARAGVALSAYPPFQHTGGYVEQHTGGYVEQLTGGYVETRKGPVSPLVSPTSPSFRSPPGVR